jgi:hypothetical protein
MDLVDSFNTDVKFRNFVERIQATAVADCFILPKPFHENLGTLRFCKLIVSRLHDTTKFFSENSQ